MRICLFWKKNNKHTISFAIDRLLLNKANESRLFDSLRTALDFANGFVFDRCRWQGEALFGTSVLPRLRVFGAAFGTEAVLLSTTPWVAAPRLQRPRVKIEADPNLLITDPSLSIEEGAIGCLPKRNHETIEWNDFYAVFGQI